MNSSAIALRGVRKRFGKVNAVDAVELEIASGEFFSLLGPSGCGKTTLLRLIAGFEAPDAGEVFIGGAAMNGTPPQARPVSTVFQNYALFPHLPVFENVAFGLRVRKVPRAELTGRVEQALELLHVADLRDRLPSEISGGQKQRVALARALVVKPQVLLLDEPLAAVDAQRRAQVQEDLRALQRESGTTFLYVTHDQDEALSLSTRLAVMAGGRIVQVGAPREIYDRPRTAFVASFIGRCNIIPGTIADASNGRARVETAVGLLTLGTNSITGRGEIKLGIRSERVLLNGPQSGENQVTCRIAGISYTGALTEYALEHSGQRIRAATTDRLPMVVGDVVRARFPAEALFILEE